MLSFDGYGVEEAQRHAYLVEDNTFPFTTLQEPDQLSSLTRLMGSQQPWGVETKNYQHLRAENITYGAADCKVLESLQDYAQTHILKRSPGRKKITASQSSAIHPPFK